MIVIKETVEEDVYQEVILTRNEVKFLEKHGSLYGKVQVNEDIINFAIRIDEEN